MGKAFPSALRTSTEFRITNIWRLFCCYFSSFGWKCASMLQFINSNGRGDSLIEVVVFIWETRYICNEFELQWSVLAGSGAHHTQAHTHIHTHTHIRTHTQTFISHKHTHNHTHTHIPTPRSIYTTHILNHTHTNIYTTHTHTHILVQAHMRIYTTAIY